MVVSNGKCLRNSIFPNFPPFLVNLPEEEESETSTVSRRTTVDVMVELRESLWRIPLAFLQLVDLEERRQDKKDRACFDSNVSIPSVFTRGNTNCSKRRSFTRPKSFLCSEEGQPGQSVVQVVGGPSEDLPHHFHLNHRDPASFSDNHAGLRLSPFPPCHQISRKDLLFVNYKKMRDRVGSDEYDFLADTYNLPEQRAELLDRMKSEPWLLWIIKPPGRNNGSGIRVISSPDDLPDDKEETCVQLYIERPYLILGRKFDLRVYVLLTSVDPLRIYIYEDGLVRFSTEQYSLDPEDISNPRIHVTNFKVNKDSEKFTVNNTPNEAAGDKWTLSCLWRYLSENLSCNVDADMFTVWADIQDLVVKSAFCGLESMRHEMSVGGKLEQKSDYNVYKLFGYDILLDHRLKPHLIEINARPAALNDTLDAYVNRPMVNEIFNIVGYHLPPAAVSNPSRKSLACRLLEADSDEYKRLGFLSNIYTRTLDNEDICKQNLFPKQTKARESYVESIIHTLTGGDVRILAKTLEEFSKLDKFSRVFPTRRSFKYLQYLDCITYYDKLLDGFINKYGEFGEEGVHRIQQCCIRNMHL